MELSEKDFRVAMINMLQWSYRNAAMNIFKINEKKEKLSKERECTKKNQMENLELKNTITEEQISVDGFKNRMERAEKDLVNLKIK